MARLPIRVSVAHETQDKSTPPKCPVPGKQNAPGVTIAPNPDPPPPRHSLGRTFHTKSSRIHLIANSLKTN